MITKLALTKPDLTSGAHREASFALEQLGDTILNAVRGGDILDVD